MLTSAHLDIVLILIEDRYTVCAKCTTGSKIILNAPDELLGGVGFVEPHFGLFRDSVSVGAR
jgi:predicted nucleic acid-binding Zn ribbon protein